MRDPLSERVNERLEERMAHSWNGVQHTSGYDPEVDQLVALAHRLQSASPLQVRPDFARQLERLLLVRNAELCQQRTARGWSFPHLLQAHPVVGAIIGLCILLLIAGTGTLVAAAQATDPKSPLYTLKRWEQHVQVSLSAPSPESQAELNLQAARDHLHALAGLATPAHAQNYRQTLVDLDQHINTAAQAINALPLGSSQRQLVSELATLKADARHTLRSFLPQLALTERLATTAELDRLGDSVPALKSVEIDLPSHPNGQATISITGTGIQAGAELLIDGRLVEVSGSLQNGVYVFVVNWRGDQHLQSIGVLNPDGAAVQTAAITLKKPGGNGNGHDNGHGHGGKPGGASPVPTPTTPPTPTPDPGFAFCDQTCTTNGFSVEYPSNWQQGTTNDGTGVQFTNPSVQDQYAAFKVAGSTSATANQLVDTDLQNNFASNSGYSPPTSSQSTTIGGVTWVYATATYDLSGQTERIQVYATVRQGKSYIIELEAADSDFDTVNTKSFETMLGSFQFQ